jgi:putative endonuclease
VRCFLADLHEEGVKAKPEREQMTEESAARPAFTYIVECSDGTLYTGWARDVRARVKAHNAGRGARYTRTRRPVRLSYWERQPSRAAAMRRERQLKRLSRAKKLALISSFQEPETSD